LRFADLINEEQFNGAKLPLAYIFRRALWLWPIPEPNKSSEVPLTIRTVDQFVPDMIGAPSTDAPLPANIKEPSDVIIRALSSALETVELERDDRCAEALRRAIAARLVGLQLETRVGNCGGEADNGRRPVQPLQKWRLKRVVEYVDTNLSNKVSLLDLAAVAGLSRMHFASQFRGATGLRPHDFLLRRRIRRSEELLRNSTMPIVEIALSVGFQTQAHFTTVFKRYVGCTPRQWRNGNQMIKIQQTRNGARAEMSAAL
jgi:AraC family transcriptional regulator